MLLVDPTGNEHYRQCCRKAKSNPRSSDTINILEELRNGEKTAEAAKGSKWLMKQKFKPGSIKKVTSASYATMR